MCLLLAYDEVEKLPENISRAKNQLHLETQLSLVHARFLKYGRKNVYADPGVLGTPLREPCTRPEVTPEACVAWGNSQKHL